MRLSFANCFGGILVGVASPALAAVGDAAVGDPIIVTGRGLTEHRADLAYDVVTISRARILQSASGRLEDVLRDVGGVQSFRRSDSRSSNATNQSITLRGLGGNATSRALLILDGVPQSDPFGGWISFPAYATDRLGAIRITRGGGSALWGAGALGGTVELDSATPDQLATLIARAAYGSYDSRDTRAAVTLKGRSSFITVSGALATGDGFTPIVEDRRGPVDHAAPYRQASGAIRAVTALGATVELQANLSAFDDRRNRGASFTDNRGRGTDGSLRLVGKGKARWSLLVYGQRRRFTNQSAAINAARTSSTLTLDQYAVPSTGWGARAELVPISGDVELRLGADLRAVRGETREFYQYVAGAATRRRAAGGRSITEGAFADVTVTSGVFTANLSGRLDRWAISHGRLFEETLAGARLTDTGFTDRVGWEPTGRAAVAVRAGGGVTVRAAAYRGWRLPTLNELYRPFRAGADATAANATLSPERLTGAEAGIDWSLSSQARAHLTLFTGRLGGAIANVTIAQGPGVFPGVGFVTAAGSYRRRENLDAILTRGAELGFDLIHRPWEMHLSYAYDDARVSDNGAGRALDGLRPAQTPEHQASGTIGWTSPHEQRLSLTAREISSQFEDDLNQRTLAPALTFDATASTPIGRRFTIGLRGENLFDKRVEAAIASDGTVERALPRTLWLEITLR
jgi:outer membrane receptor protein involved in Fe transport